MFRSGPKSRMVAILLILVMLLGQLSLSPAPTLAANTVSKNSATLQETFKDVTPSNPNFVFINFLNKRGLLQGFPNGTFQPAAGLTRAEAATVLVKAAGLTIVPVKTVFKDVNPKYWAAASIAAAKNAGLLSGYPDGTFRPEAKLTRAEGIALILKLSKQPDPGVDLPVLADIAPKHWAAKPVAVGLSSEMVGLSSDNKHFLPDTPLTRGALARALAVLLTKDPALYETSLTDKLNVVAGPVTVTRAGSKTPETITGSTELQPGDTLNTGASGLADIVFPDGTGLRLEKDSQFILKEARGRLYIKPDGTPGIAIEWLAIDLKSGKMFGALATGAQANKIEGSKSTAGKAAGALARTMGLGSLSENRVRTAAAPAKPLPWWQQSGMKRTKVKIDMPTGVAAIRGTFWENKVNPDGSFVTTLLTGSAEVTAGGKAVDLAGGQRTEVTSTGAPPAPPAPMTTEDRKEWVAQTEWAKQRAEEIVAQQEKELPPPPPAEKPEEPAVPQETQNPSTEQPKPLEPPTIDDLIDETLSNLGPADQTLPDDSPGDGGSSVVAVTGISLNTDSLSLVANGGPGTLTATVSPANASNQSVTWNSSDESVAIVSNGIITPLAEGTATITVTTTDGGFHDSCAVTVSPSAAGGNTIRISSIEQVSISSGGAQANDTSGAGEYPSSVSANGRYIAFFSYASNLVAGDTNSQPDIFVRDRITGENVLVSVKSDGTLANNDSRAPVISADGRYVAFSSYATNLVDNDLNGAEDIFLHDRDTDNDGVYDEPGHISTVRVNVAADGTPANAGANAPHISADSRYITFYSTATNIDPAVTDSNLYNAANGVTGYDIFVHDMQTGETQLVSVSTAGIQANKDCYFPSISPDGRYVAYSSGATTLVPGVTTFGIFVRDLVYNTTTYILPNASDPVMSSNGQYMAYSSGNDIYVRDRDVNSTGVFDQVYRNTKLTVSINGGLADSYSYKPSISGDGRYVAFTSHATNLVPYDTNASGDIFVVDTDDMVIKRVSAPIFGGETDYDNWYQALSADGSMVVFTSDSTNLVTGDTDDDTDIFAVTLVLDSPPDNTPPSSPAGLHSITSGPSWMSLGWNPATDNNRVILHSVWRGTSIDGPFDEIGTVYGNVYSYWDSNLSPSTTYYYYVQAQDEDGNVSAVAAAAPFETPALPGTAPDVVPLTAGAEYSLARMNDGTVWAWGENYDGSLGINTTSSTPTPTHTVYNGVYFNNVSALDAYYHTLAVRADGTVWAWGSNEDGQLGFTPDYNDHTTPVQVAGLTNIKAVAAGEYHSLALGSDGTVWSWGDNSNGQLGNRYYTDVPTYTPARVVGPDGTGYLTDVIAISSGYCTSVALKADGTVWTWGYNYWGDLGIGINDNYDHPVPVQVQGLTGIVAISGGYDHYLALKSDGTVWAWGYNGSGELGDNTTQIRYAPVQVLGPGGTGYLTGVTAIAAGWYHSLAIKSDGTVWAWGDNSSYQLGDTTWADRHTPIQVLGPGGTNTLSGITAIAADYDHSLALKSDGTIWAWGTNCSGELGDGTTTDRSTPVQVNIPVIP